MIAGNAVMEGRSTGPRMSFEAYRKGWKRPLMGLQIRTVTERAESQSETGVYK